MESPEVFEAYALVDWSYYELERLQKKFNKPRSPIERMIDATVGYKPNEAVAKEMLEVFAAMVYYKKIIDADTSETDEAIAKLLELMPNLKYTPYIPELPNPSPAP